MHLSSLNQASSQAGAKENSPSFPIFLESMENHINFPLKIWILMDIYIAQNSKYLDQTGQLRILDVQSEQGIHCLLKG